MVREEALAAISIQNLSKVFGTFRALSDVTLEVQAGEFVTLLGPSGCGKTTLLKLISGFLEPSEGKIVIDDADVTKVPPEERDTALCFQSYALFPHLNVRENLEFGLKQKRIPVDERRERIANVAVKLGLEPEMDKLPNQLSGGQQQRVSLGRALVMRPSVILFDEPLSNLDAKLRDQVRVEIRRIQQEYKLTAIYVTHDQAEALAMSDRIVVLNAGRVEQIDTPEQLYAAPRTSFVADFIGDANVFQAKVLGEESPGLWLMDTPMGVLKSNRQPGPNGALVNLCWRPEEAQVGTGELTGTVRNRAFQGHFTDLAVEAGNASFRIRTNRSDAREGEEIRFSIPSDCVIPLESEQ